MKSKNKLSILILKQGCNLIKLVPMYLLFVAIAFFLSMQVHISFPVRGYYLFALGVIIAYLIRYYIKKLLPYIALHALLCPILIVLSGSSLLIFLSLLFCLLFYIYAYQYWCSDEVGVVIKLPIPFVIAFFFFYLLSLQRGNAAYSPYFFTLSILYVLASIIGNYIIRMEAYMIENKKNDSISLKKVLIRNTRSGMIPLVILVLFPLLSNIPIFHEVAYQIYHAVTGFLLKVFRSLLTDMSTKEMKTFMPNPSATVSDPPKIPPDTSRLAIVIQHILVFMGYCLLAFLIITTIWNAFKILTSNRRKASHEKIGDNFDGIQEIRTKIEPPRKEHHIHFHRKTPTDKIREHYFKTIIGYEKQGYEINEYHSPSERNADIEKEYNDDLSTLTKEYESVRYNKSE